MVVAVRGPLISTEDIRVRRKKPPKGVGSNLPPFSPSPPPPDWVQEWDNASQPQPGDPAPNLGVIYSMPDADQERHMREARIAA